MVYIQCDLDLGTAHFRWPACTVADPCVLVVAQAGLRYRKLGIEGSILRSGTIDRPQLSLSSLEQKARRELTSPSCLYMSPMLSTMSHSHAIYRCAACLLGRRRSFGYSCSAGAGMARSGSPASASSAGQQP